MTNAVIQYVRVDVYVVELINGLCGCSRNGKAASTGGHVGFTSGSHIHKYCFPVLYEENKDNV
jgi:hypothetical protein